MFFIDVQGTLISDSDRSVLNGACEFIEYLNSNNTPYMVVTNNTKYESTQFLKNLQNKGLNIAATHYLDPLMLLDDYLETKNIAAYGDSNFLKTLEEKGYILDFHKPSYVVIGVKQDFTNEHFAQIIEFLLQGARLIGMHESTLYAKDGKRYPGTGAILQMLRSATMSEYAVVGKPSHAFYTQANEMLSKQINRGINFEEITMISDDMKGDLVGAKQMGMKTIFVLSGKYQEAKEIIPYIFEDLRPDHIFKEMRTVLEHYKGSHI